MSSSIPTVVYDCNIFIQALININGPSGSYVSHSLAGNVLLLLSAYVLSEIREAPNKPTPARLGVTVERTETLIDDLLKSAVIVPAVPTRFAYPRDPDDAHYVNLALAGDAQVIVSRDKDLLSLMDMTRPDGRNFHNAFPALRVLDPVQFLRDLHRASGATPPASP